MREEAIDFIISRILAGERDLERLKRQAAKRYGLLSMIKKPEILARFPESSLTPEIRDILRKKPTKTLSGVTPVAVMIRPQDSCSFGCAYCPSTGLAAKSYTGYEPAAMRARQYGFDPFLQASNRVAQFEGGGHPADKCEVIVMGGTFLGMDKGYKESFIKGVYDGLNGQKAASLQEAISLNERSRHRAVGLTIETRPDMCIPYIEEMLSFGATRCELGVQHADDGIYRLVNRGHTVQDVVDSTRALKDAAFKVLYHIMPGLPGSSPEKDIAFVKRLFSDPLFRPDMLKLYPTLVMEGTVLHQWLEDGRYEAYTAEESAEVISESYRHIPKYVRVMRIQRDIPAGLIESGVRKSNLRELVEARLREKGIAPQEIRYREAGLSRKRPDLSSFSLRRMDYEASGGDEVFLSFEDDEGLIAGFARLRLPKDGAALLRELHVYGASVPLSSRGDVQHHGLGLSLLQEAERIAKEEGRDSLLVISGVGVREYYRRHGYSLEGHYMAKCLA